MSQEILLTINLEGLLAGPVSSTSEEGRETKLVKKSLKLCPEAVENFKYGPPPAYLDRSIKSKWKNLSPKDKLLINLNSFDEGYGIDWEVVE